MAAVLEVLRAQDTVLRHAASDFVPAANPRLHGFELGLVQDRQQFDALEDEWNALFERSGDCNQVFQTFAWCRHWADHFLKPGGNSRLAIITAREAGRLVMIWPLVVETRLGLRLIRWMGEPVSQYGDVLVEGGPLRRRLLILGWHTLVGRLKPDQVLLRKVRTDGAVAPLLAELGSLTAAHAEAPYLDLASAENFDTYQERYSSKARKNRRRQRRRLDERGQVRFAMIPPGKLAGDIAALGISMKRAWLKDRGILSSAIQDNRVRRFFRAIAADTRNRAGCQVSQLRTGGETAAIQVGFACKGRIAMHVIVYNLKLEKCAPGALAIEDCIAEAYRAGAQTLDLLAPNDGYKMEWADGVVAVCDHALPLTALGRLHCRLTFGFLRERLKAAAARLPVAIRKPLVQLHAMRAGG